LSEKSIFIIFPHQLFQDIELLKNVETVYLVEEYLFFNQYKFHKQKLVLHRASMKYYENLLRENKIKVNYIEAVNSTNNISILIKELRVTEIHYYDVCDNWLDKRITEACIQSKINAVKHSSPLFINTESDLKVYFEQKSKYFHADFYIQQRKKLNILIDENQKPYGGKWSFDSDNRLKYPKDKTAPKVIFPTQNSFYKDFS
jgi:deoxyribodipyrimidine photolyase-related protein